MVGFAWQVPLVTFRTPPISVLATLSAGCHTSVRYKQVRYKQVRSEQVRSEHRDQARRGAPCRLWVPDELGISEHLSLYSDVVRDTVCT